MSDYFSAANISVVIPVKDNQRGLDNILGAFRHLSQRYETPREIIIVDDGSMQALDLHGVDDGLLPIVYLRHERTQGRGGARNEGVRHASGKWLLFTDSDCLPNTELLRGYAQAVDRSAIAYAGAVYPSRADLLSQYYGSLNLLIPFRTNEARPAYLVTANALVLREAFLDVGGFDRCYHPAGEDIDLGIRLAQIGQLAYALEAIVLHDFGDGFLGFIDRFWRYGRGSRLLEHGYGDQRFVPQLFYPPVTSYLTEMLSVVRFICSLWGYKQCEVGRLWKPLNELSLPRGISQEALVYLFAAIVGDLMAMTWIRKPRFSEQELRGFFALSLMLLSFFSRVEPSLEDRFVPQLLTIKKAFRW